MADDLKQRGGQDRTRIDVHQEHEVRDWAHKFGVTPDALLEAVRRVGTQASDVERALAQAKPER